MSRNTTVPRSVSASRKRATPGRIQLPPPPRFEDLVGQTEPLLPPRIESPASDADLLMVWQQYTTQDFSGGNYLAAPVVAPTSSATMHSGARQSETSSELYQGYRPPIFPTVYPMPVPGYDSNSPMLCSEPGVETEAPSPTAAPMPQDGPAWDGQMSSICPPFNSIEGYIAEEIAAYDMEGLLNYKEPGARSKRSPGKKTAAGRGRTKTPKASPPAKRVRSRRNATPGPSTLPASPVRRRGRARKGEPTEDDVNKLSMYQRYVPVASSPLKSSMFASDSSSDAEASTSRPQDNRWYIPKRKLSPDADPSEMVADSDSDSPVMVSDSDSDSDSESEKKDKKDKKDKKGKKSSAKPKESKEIKA